MNTSTPQQDQSGDAPLPLSGIRVLDLSRVLAGPWATQMLADLGAEVIKVERPGAGDDTRGWGPPWVRSADGGETRESAYFLCANRGKRSVEIDLTSEAGRAALLRLAKDADVLVENYKVGGLARYGLDYASVRAMNPRIVYCSITGFGQDGPYKDRAGYDFMIQGLGGLMSITGEADGRPGGGPQKVGVAVVDLFTGMYASVAILAALRHREQGGPGQYIDMALFDCSVAMLANVASNYLVSEKRPARFGNAHPNIVPYQAFRCRDGFLILAVGNDEQFARFCAEAGLADIAADERYRRNSGRVQHREALCARIAECFLTRDRDDWLGAFERLGIPAGPINTVDQVFRDPQLLARGLRLDLPHPSAGSVPGVANPIRFSETPLRARRAPPTLGQDNEADLDSLNWS